MLDIKKYSLYNQTRKVVILMKDRIKKIRKEFDLTQQEFAERIGSKRNTIAKYETNTNVPSAAVISLICREFNVNENWLRTGEGEMFLSTSHHDVITKFMEQLLLEESNSFKNRLISVLADLDVTEWEILERRMQQLFGKTIEEKFTKTVQKELPTEISVSIEPAASTNFFRLTIDEKVALYRQELEREEKVEEEFEVS